MRFLSDGMGDSRQPALTSLRLYWLLIISALVVPAALFAVAAVDNRARVLREGEDTVTRTAAMLHEHAVKVFETADLTLTQVDDHIHDLSWQQIADPATSAFLARLKAPMDQVVSIWIVDAQGGIRAGSVPWDHATQAADRDFLRVQAERDARNFVSGVFRGETTHEPSFAISRRRSTPDGHFDGVIFIALSPDYFSRFFAEAAPDIKHRALLMRADGEILARDPRRPVDTPMPASTELMQHIALQPAGGFFSGISHVEQEPRIFAYRKVGLYPVYVGFAVATASLMDRWFDTMTLYGVAAVAGALTLLLVSWLALRSGLAERALLLRLSATVEQLKHETAQREVAEQHRHHAQKLEAIGQLTGGIAHDFNNLLTVVQGSLELLQKRLPASDERTASLLAVAMQGAERGAALTQRLLAFGRRQALEPEAVDISHLVRGLAGLLRSSLGPGVQVEMDFPPGLAAALVDANQLELAVLNLAGNGRDAMAGKGMLTIAAREEMGDGAEPGTPANAYIVLRVSDTGSGMDAATLAQATEPFFTTKGVGKGTGLGLSMVHGLAAQSGGRLVLHSEVGKGTTAELWLPRAEVTDVARIPPIAKTNELVSRRIRRSTILAVDDDPLVLASVTVMLEDMGHIVLAAEAGSEALEIIRADAAVDLVVTDQLMPGMTGTQLAAELRRMRPDLPVLLMTGFAERAEVVASGLPLLHKPPNQPALAKMIGICLSAVAGSDTIVAFRGR